MTENRKNLDVNVVKHFGSEWSRFDQSGLSATDHTEIFNDYFHIFPWSDLPSNAVGADIGCGSGRWAMLVAPHVGMLHCVDPSRDALRVARQNLIRLSNVRFHESSVDALPFPDDSLDFAYSLGVLHHVPDTAAAIRSVAAKLKPGAPFLIYLYYAFDNRPAWFRLVWQASDLVRRTVARLPHMFRYLVSQILAITVYWPLARLARGLERSGRLPASWPLAYYRDKAFYVMRTDALDRFGTRLEQRFTRAQIQAMLESVGFIRVCFSDCPPYWCAVAEKG
ncbi:MAG: class I SAM-dependent methyltransferase [Methanosarcinales archaeon]|nr:MAG: class I SAM-dependent methyltransferase [Methanosarcinales archaeon]